MVDVACSIRDNQWIFLCHTLLLFSDRSQNPIVHGERIITPDWLKLRQAMYGSRVTPLWPHKYAQGKKSAMIVLSGHFKTLIFIKSLMFWVLNYMVITVDHCTLTHSRSIVCYLLSVWVDSTCYRNTVVCPSSLICHYNYNYIPNGIVCLRFQSCKSGLGNSNVCAAIVPFFSITFVGVCQLSPLCAINECTPTTAWKCCSYLNY